MSVQSDIKFMRDVVASKESAFLFVGAVPEEGPIEEANELTLYQRGRGSITLMHEFIMHALVFLHGRDIPAELLSNVGSALCELEQWTATQPQSAKH